MKTAVEIIDRLVGEYFSADAIIEILRDNGYQIIHNDELLDRHNKAVEQGINLADQVS